MPFPKTKKYRVITGFLTLLLIGGGLAYYQFVHAVTRTWDGGGTDGTCGGAGTANNWSCAANWSGDAVPGTSDIALFDTTSTKNATINANVSVAGIDINTGYTGTITQSGSFTVTVGSSNYDQADGTFTGGSGAITVNRAFTLSNGTFTSTSGTLTFGYSGSSITVFTVSGGTFNHNDGTVRFSAVVGGYGSSQVYTVDVPTLLTLHHVEFDVNFTPAPCILTTALGDTVIVTGDFVHSNGKLDGTWEVQGNVTIGSGADGSQSGSLTMTGTGSKTYAYSSGGTGPHLRINNPALSVTAASGTTDLKLSILSVLSGTFSAPSGTLEIGRIYYVGTETILTVSGGTFNHNNGTVKFFSSFGGIGTSSTFTIDVPTTLTLYNVDESIEHSPGAGILATASGDTVIVANDFTHTNGQLAGTWQVQGDMTVATTADGGTATLSFTGGNDQTYTDQGGNEPDGDITVNKSAGTVTLASSADWNAANQDLTITSGTLFSPAYSLSTGALSVGASGVLYLSGSQTLTLGGNLSNAGVVKIWGHGVCGGSDTALLRSSSTGTQRSWSGAGSFTVSDADIRDMAGTAAITAASSTNTGNNGGNWTFSSACTAAPPAVNVGSGMLNVRSGIMNIR